MLAAVEDALQRAHREAAIAYEAAHDWRSGMRAATHTILDLIDQERALARICIVDAPAAGERVIERRERYLRRFAAAIDIGREHCSARSEPQPLTAHAVAGGILTVLQSHLLEHDERPAGELAGSLMALIVLPYLGRAAANREYLNTAPARPPRTQRRRSSTDRAALAELNLRMTYRTIRVLSAIREHPGASNRAIAHAAGIVDQGQISKLLKRLTRQELIENLGDGQSRGASNAWHLTALGAQVQQLAKPG